VRRRGGFTLIELTMAIIVLSVFMTLSMKLFRSTMDVVTSRPRHDATARQLDRAVEAMRADAWGALDMRLADARTLIIRPTGDNTLIWKLDPDDETRGHIERGVYLDERQIDRADWHLAGGDLRFDADGSIITLTWTDTIGRTRRWPLYSQLRILVGGGS
jgi:prepilin-type N-terminal cleavage/methylation domain-containing protein